MLIKQSNAKALSRRNKQRKSQANAAYFFSAGIEIPNPCFISGSTSLVNCLLSLTDHNTLRCYRLVATNFSVHGSTFTFLLMWLYDKPCTTESGGRNAEANVLSKLDLDVLIIENGSVDCSDAVVFSLSVHL